MRYPSHKYTGVTGQNGKNTCEYNNVQLNELITILPQQVVITTRTANFQAK